MTSATTRVEARAIGGHAALAAAVIAGALDHAADSTGSRVWLRTTGKRWLELLGCEPDAATALIDRAVWPRDKERATDAR